MARKSVLTKEQIVQCAFELCTTEGLSNVTIRNMAKELNTSTAPIYTQYANREMILDDLDVFIKDELHTCMRAEYTLNPFLNIGVGIVDFTLKNHRLVSEFFFNLKRISFEFGSENIELIEQMKGDKYLSLLDDERLMLLLDDMRIYVFGLVAMICSDSEIKELLYYQNKLERVGEKLIIYHLQDAKII
jgi:AcrR family transcriptional regulator